MHLRRALTTAVFAALSLNVALGQTPLGTDFTYQGQLKQAGQPFNGSANLVFRLYDASSAGNLVGTQTLNSVGVSGGLFTVVLDFGAGAFNSEARWLEVNVNGTPLAPRQPITAAPYALSLAPGATIYGGANGLNALTLYHSDVLTSAIYALHTATGGTALFAESDSGAGAKGVWGVSSEGIGVYGSSDTGAAGVYGSSSTGKFGVYGTSPGPTGFANTLVGAGVLGDSSTNDGVTGICSAASRSGVSGYAQDVNGGGVYGKNNASGNVGGFGTASFGAWGSSGSAAGYGGYFQNYGGGVALYADGPVNAQVANELSAIYGETTAGGGFHGGVRGVSTGLNGNGVLGTAYNGTGAWGVDGESHDGVGVAGEATTGIGVLAVSDSGNGLKATSNSYDGIDGASSGAGKSGVYGHTDNAAGFGVAGWNWAVDTNGALGTQTAGVTGNALQTTGQNYGVFGSTSSSAGYGGYFVGRGYFSDFVGIEIEQPAVPLQVAGGTDATLSDGGNIVVGQIDAANVVMDNNEIMARNNGAAANLYLNALGGNVGIGTNNPQGFTLAVGGTAAKTNGGPWSTLSDARAKKNIRDLPAGSLDRLLALRGRTFEYLPEAIQSGLVTAGEHSGFVAQEVEPVLPDWVETTAGGTKFISEHGATALLVEALRELRAEKDRQVEELRNQKDRELAARDAKIAELTERLDRLEQRLGSGEINNARATRPRDVRR